MTQPLARGVVRVFRLTDEPGGLGLSCTPMGVSLAGVPLLRKTKAGFALRPAAEIASLLKAAYGDDPTGLQSRLGVIAQALNSGDIAKAMIAAVHTRTPELSPEAALRLAKADREFGKYNYDSDEPRDWHGRWTRDGSTASPGMAAPRIQNEFISMREAFLKDLAENHAAELRDAGMSDTDIAEMAKGNAPESYQVHHTLPLDDGGTNATSNLMLIRKDPDHILITNYQNERTRGMLAGQTRQLEWPMPDSRVLIWPKTPGRGAHPTVHKLEWPKIADGGVASRRALTRRASMSDIDDLLAAVNTRKRAFAEMIQPPASPEAIARLRRLARDALRTDLPESYVTFLRRNDGLAFNNCEIYAATERKKPYLPGFVEVNEILIEGGRRYVFYGDTGDELYAQDRMSRAWVALDRPSLSVLETFPSFDAMLAQVLRDSLRRRTGT